MIVICKLTPKGYKIESMDRCLRCYSDLNEGEIKYHKECVDSLFVGVDMDNFQYTVEDIERSSKSRIAPIALSIFEPSTVVEEVADRSSDDPFLSRFTFYREGAELTDLTMKLAQAAHIVTASHSLVSLSDGSRRLAVRRVDIDNEGRQLPMEDVCQISELSFEERYEGEYEQITEMIEECSSVNRIDLITLWEHVVFAWICGNSDFNLSQIALNEPYAGICSLAPLRFATSVALYDPSKVGAMALGVNGKRRGVGRADLEAAMRSTALKNRAINLIFKKFVASRDVWFELVDNSWLEPQQKADYKILLDRQLKILEVI